MKTKIKKYWQVLTQTSFVGRVFIVASLIGPLGFLINFKPFKGLGLAWMISPLPIVFSDVNGYEAFGAQFVLKLHLKDQTINEKNITYKEGSKILGPYNRRNIYGAIIGYAPRIPTPLFQSVMKHAFCRQKTLVKEFNLPEDITRVELLIYDGTAGRENINYNFEVACLN